MPNNFSSDLILDKISSRIDTVLGNRLAPLSAFATDFSEEGMQQGQNVRFGQATVGSTTLTNPTNWESGDSNISNINVPVNHYAQPFHITPRQRNNGRRLEDLIDVNLDAFADKLIDVAFAPLTTSNYSNITVAQASIAAANLKTALAGVAKSPVKNIILDSVAYYNLAPNDKNGFELGQGAYGFDGFFLNTRWNGAGTNIYGFAGGPKAMAMVAGLPEYDDDVREDLNMRTMRLDKLGLSVVAATWISRATRTRWASYEVAFGSVKLDGSAGYVFKSA